MFELSQNGFAIIQSTVIYTGHTELNTTPFDMLSELTSKQVYLN